VVVWWAGFGGCGGFVLAGLRGSCSQSVVEEAQGPPPGKVELRHQKCLTPHRNLSQRERARTLSPLVWWGRIRPV
jgi:hypothetical protein